jgi:hypothetical protein
MCHCNTSREVKLHQKKRRFHTMCISHVQKLRLHKTLLAKEKRPVKRTCIETGENLITRRNSEGTRISPSNCWYSQLYSSLCLWHDMQLLPLASVIDHLLSESSFFCKLPDPLQPASWLLIQIQIRGHSEPDVHLMLYSHYQHHAAFEELLLQNGTFCRSRQITLNFAPLSYVV